MFSGVMAEKISACVTGLGADIQMASLPAMMSASCNVSTEQQAEELFAFFVVAFDMFDDDVSRIGQDAGRRLLGAEMFVQLDGVLRVQPIIINKVWKKGAFLLKNGVPLGEHVPHAVRKAVGAVLRFRLPERDFRRGGDRLDEHVVMGDAIDGPCLRAERETLADARLPDELFVQFADQGVVGRLAELVEAAVRNGSG